MAAMTSAAPVRCMGFASRAAPTSSLRLGAAAPLPSKVNGLGAGLALPVRRRAPLAARGTVVVRAAVDPVALNDAAQALYTLAEAEEKKGFLTPVVNALEAVLKVLDSGLEAAGLEYSYGWSIILLTLLVKLATYPLSKKQVESTLAMQTLQPQIKELQKKFAYDKERLQMETARLYQDAGVNPLAGCLPTLATLPIWIGLYRALSNVADEGLLTEGFFWIPSLAGPTALAARDAGYGAPPVGWEDAIAYLVMPVLLTASQFVSQAIISPPKSDDPSQAQANAILKFLPFMIGWFSLNVPSGLTLYWFTNNILTTAQQVYLRKASQPAMAGAGAGGSSMGGSMPASATVVDVEPMTNEDSSMSRRERRALEKKEKRGQRFAERKAAEAAGKSDDAPPAEPKSDESA